MGRWAESELSEEFGVDIESEMLLADEEVETMNHPTAIHSSLHQSDQVPDGTASTLAAPVCTQGAHHSQGQLPDENIETEIRTLVPEDRLSSQVFDLVLSLISELVYSDTRLYSNAELEQPTPLPPLPCCVRTILIPILHIDIETERWTLGKLDIPGETILHFGGIRRSNLAANTHEIESLS